MTKEIGSEMKVIEIMDEQRFNTSSHNMSVRSNKNEEDKHQSIDSTTVLNNVDLGLHHPGHSGAHNQNL